MAQHHARERLPLERSSAAQPLQAYLLALKSDSTGKPFIEKE
jgi:hypothetical protein